MIIYVNAQGLHIWYDFIRFSSVYAFSCFQQIQFIHFLEDKSAGLVDSRNDQFLFFLCQFTQQSCDIQSVIAIQS